MRRILFFTALIATVLPVYTQIQSDFEKEIPANWQVAQGGEISLSQEHFKSGTSSLQWDWNAKNILTVTASEEMKKAIEADGHLMCWFYNEKPVNAPLVISFSGNGKTQYMFNFNLAFSGWRACCINFDQMLGEKDRSVVDRMQIMAPRQGEGRLFIDRLSFNTTKLNRLGSDAQMPWLAPDKNISRWLGLWYRYITWEYDIPLESSVSPAQKQYFDLIFARIQESIKGAKPSVDRMTKAKGRYEEYRIKRNGKNITGKPIVMSFDKTDNDFNLAQAASVLLELARVWHHSNDQSFIEMYINLLDHLIDQGFDIGSHMGSVDHYGYAFRDIAPSMVLMRPALEATGRLEYCSRIIGYWSDLQINRKSPDEVQIEGYCDIWNTQLPSKVMAIALMKDGPEKWREYLLLNRWTSRSLAYTPGTFGGIKPDGTVFHHWGIYMGYAVPAFAGLGNYVQWTNHTPFQLTDEALSILGRTLLENRFFMQKNYWGFGICGRAPLDGELAGNALQCFGHVANAGEPFTGNDVWKELAEAYLRLGGKDIDLTRKFMGQLVSAERSPQGNRTYNYAALGVHRRNDWAVFLKAYNKHVWSTEIYTTENRFGRYISYGTAQIVSKDSPRECGFRSEGWDWNRFPGATTIHLPLDILNPPVKGTVVILSPEKLGGASSLENKDGLLGMILQEPDRPHFNPSFRAYKSIFCFDNLMVFLGSGISNENREYPTETTLFQYALNGKKDPILYNRKKIDSFPFEVKADQAQKNILADPAGNYYFVPEGQSLMIERKEQTSRDHRDREDTKGLFTSAWIAHGAAPQQASYHYAVLVQPSDMQADGFVNQVMKNEWPYQVWKQDNQAHVVESKATSTMAYVLFEPTKNLNIGNLNSTSSECFVMFRSKGGGKALMSVCHPHLNLPLDKMEGPNERAIYAPSQPIEIEVEIKGEWSLPPADNYQFSITKEGNTRIRVTCVNGMPVEMQLTEGR